MEKLLSDSTQVGLKWDASNLYAAIFPGLETTCRLFCSGSKVETGVNKDMRELFHADVIRQCKKRKKYSQPMGIRHKASACRNKNQNWTQWLLH